MRRRELVVWSDEGIAIDFPALDVGAEHVGPVGLGAAARARALRARHRRRRAARLRRGRRDCAALEAHRDPRPERQPDRADLRRRWAPLRRSSTAPAAPCACSRRARAASRRSRSTTPARAASGSPSRATPTTRAATSLPPIDAEGHVARYQYDDEHRLTRETDREGLAFSFVYDRQGRCVETWGEYPGQARSEPRRGRACEARGRHARPRRASRADRLRPGAVHRGRRLDAGPPLRRQPARPRRQAGRGRRRRGG